MILAAGRSERMGRSKALLPWGHTTLLGAWIERFLDAGARPVAVVLGAELALTRSATVPTLSRPDDVRWIANPDAEGTGPRESLLLGLDALPADRPAWFTPVDVPVVSLTSLRAIARAWDAAHSDPATVLLAALPRHGSQTGHPVLAGPALVARLFEGERGDRIDELLAWARRRVLEVDVDDSRVLRDMDTPEDYAREVADRGDPSGA